PAEVERMREEADMFADEDEQRKVIADLKNRADTLLYSYEATMRDNADLIDAAKSAEAAENAQVLRAAMQDKTIEVEELQQALEDLQQTIFAIGATLYQQANEENYDVSEGASVEDVSETVSNQDVSAEIDPFSGIGEDSAPAETDAATAPTVDMGSMDQPEFDLDATLTADYEAIE
ncbi:MAG: Hsp70 family protein, partial [Cyanobacteria bacterium P01_D01_bin.44]